MVGKETPKCSVVITSYRPYRERLNLCIRTLDTVFNTGIPREDYEVILVDNGGLCPEIFDNYDIDVLIRNKVNWGQAIGLNQAIRLAKSDRIAMMDDDLHFEEGWLKKGLELLDRYNKVLISLRGLGKKWKYKTGETKEGNILASKVGGCWIFNKKIIDEIGEFNPHVYSFGGNFTRNLIRRGYRFLVSKRPYIYHFGRGKSLYHRFPEEYSKWLHDTFDDYEDPIASIIICTFCPNKERYELIKESFTNLRKTGMPYYELIIVNNGGIQQDLIDKIEPDIEIINKRNVGNHEGFNQGALLSNGEILAWMDDDIEYKPGWLNKGVEYVEKYPEHIISLRDISDFWKQKKHIIGEKDGHTVTSQAGGCWVFKKDIYEKIGRMSPSPWRGQGWYARKLTREGHCFLLAEPYIKHLGKNKSIIPKNPKKWKGKYTKNPPQL